MAGRFSPPCRAAAVAVTLFAVTLGCTDDAGRSTTPTTAGIPAELDDDLAELIETTQASLDEYWQVASADVTEHDYASPAAWHPYYSAAPPTGLGCDPRVWEATASYCFADSTIAYDVDWLAGVRERAGRDGDAIATAILAHEFGRHIQAIHDRPFRAIVSQELQADCYAGMFLAGGRGPNGATILRAIAALAGMADSTHAQDPWFAAGLHGDTVERSQALFSGGLGGGASYCAAYEHAAPGDPLELGGWSLRLLPTATSEAYPESDGNGFHIIHITNSSFPDIQFDVTTAGNLPANAGAALAQAAPEYFTGSTVSYIGGTRLVSTPLGLDGATVRYEQFRGADHFHGFLLLVTTGTSSGLVLDVFADGPPPAAEAGWLRLAEYLLASLYGVTP